MSKTAQEGSTSEKVIHLAKLKTAEYRVLRRMRDKGKHFARSAGVWAGADLFLEDAQGVQRQLL